MPDAGETRRSPYQGLTPFLEEDAPYFFGRNRETRLIIANLFASPLTLVYGASGVGKSSVLRAGAVHKLLGREDVLVTAFSRWQHRPGQLLKDAVRHSAIAAGTQAELPASDQPLPEFLVNTALATQRRLLLILDQFEELFRYSEEADGFASELPVAINSSDPAISFLISIREDALAKLDRFEGRIPNLFENYLRIDHLDPQAAREATEGPIGEFNRRHAEEEPYRLESDVVGTVLARLQQEPERGGHFDDIAPHDQGLIQSPYLQLVLTRLWNEEVKEGSHELRIATFELLGGAERIVRRHLDDVLDPLGPVEQAVAARIFTYLVSPDGGKIALSPHALASWSKLELGEVQRVLELLATPDHRILRTIEPPPGHPAATRYEIFHDRLCAAIGDWQHEFEQTEALQEREAQLERWYEEEQARRRLARRRWVTRSGLVITLLAGIWWYQHNYLPWGHLHSLTAGRTSTLAGDSVKVGRNTPNVMNDVPLAPNNVSRRHVEIARDGFLVDLRSRNGTTVNARFVPYGASRKLEDGDIVVLAGIAPFRYTHRSSDPSPPPAGAWGMVVDGDTRDIQYLTGSVHSVALHAEEGVEVRDDVADDALLLIRHSDQGRVTIEDRTDSQELSVYMKSGDYRYPGYTIPPGRVFDAFVTENDEPHDLFEVAYEYQGRPFQMVIIDSGLFPPEEP